MGGEKVVEVRVAALTASSSFAGFTEGCDGMGTCLNRGFDLPLGHRCTRANDDIGHTEAHSMFLPVSLHGFVVPVEVRMRLEGNAHFGLQPSPCSLSKNTEVPPYVILSEFVRSPRDVRAVERREMT